VHAMLATAVTAETANSDLSTWTAVAISLVALVFSITSFIMSCRASARDRLAAERNAQLDRLISGPIPEITVVFPVSGELRSLNITVHNRGRGAATARGAGLMYP